MARPKSEILSDMGGWFEILTAIVNVVLDSGGTDDDLRVLRTPNGKDKLGRIAAIIVEKPAKAEPPPVPEPVIIAYKLTINYTRPLMEVVEDGEYDWVNPDFNQNNFPVVGDGTVDEELYTIHFQRDLGDEALVAKCKRLGYEIVGNTEGAHFGAQYSELQKQFPIIFGSVWQHPDCNRNRPCLGRNDTKRDLDLYWIFRSSLWRADCRVLVRKIRNSVAR